LDLSGNSLQDVSAVAALPSLRKLNLAGNVLATLVPQATATASASPPPAGCFPVLELLDLSYNRLEAPAIQFLAALPCLRELDISGGDR